MKILKFTVLILCMVWVIQSPPAKPKSFSLVLPPYVERTVPVVSDEDIHWMALNIYYEARNLDVEAQTAVAYVTINRKRDDRWPNDIKSVVTDYAQFSWYWDGKPDRPYELEAWADAQELAEMILLDVARNGFYDDLTGWSTHYHADHITPEWSESFAQSVQLGTHIFYY